MIIDFILNLISHLPKLFNWWLYSPKRTDKNIDVSISASDSSIEIWCGQREFRIRPEFRNNNPFPIEVDRLEIKGSLDSVRLTATQNFGTEIPPKKKTTLTAEGKFDTSTEIQIKQTKDDTTIRLELIALIINKCHRIRNFRRHFENLLCRVINKKV